MINGECDDNTQLIEACLCQSKGNHSAVVWGWVLSTYHCTEGACVKYPEQQQLLDGKKIQIFGSFRNNTKNLQSPGYAT